MRSLVSALLLLQTDAVLEETSLMQGLVARRGQMSTEGSSRKDNTAKLMETATKMMKNGATPDVVTFIETTITEVNSQVLGAIVDEHHHDQDLINDLLARFDAAIAQMEACAASVIQQHTDRDVAVQQHQLCRADESLECARSRKCEEELEELWRIVKMEEEEMREIHWDIHGQWCAPVPPPHPGLDDPFEWQPVTSMEGPETSLTDGAYPVVDYTADVIEFRHFSVTAFGRYIEQKPKVEIAWENYNLKLLECAAKEETWTLKVDDCDAIQDTMQEQACEHVSNNRQCAADFGHEYHMTMIAYNNAVTTIRQLEYDRKREWETLHIVTCLLETVYTHVIHSIQSGEPCPTTESHPDQTAAEINTCHVIEDSFTANLTIDYGTPPEPPTLPPVVEPPCTAQYIWETTGSFSAEIQGSHRETIALEGLESYFTTISSFGWAGCAAPKACTPCESTELVVDPEYTECTTCMAHQAHLHPGQMDWDTFKCLTNDECIRSSGRCNGESQCTDGSDELGCENHWGVPAILGEQACNDVFSSDVQFQCGNGMCTDIAAKCNGVNNCGDASDEEGCATTTTGITVEAMTGFTATIETPTINSEIFYDRTYVVDSLGSFTGHSMVKVSNEDKHIRHSHVQTKLRLAVPTTVYIAKLDSTNLPWLAEEGWAMTSLEGITYHGVRETRHTEWSGVLNEDEYGPGAVYEKTFPAGVIELRGNNGGDGSYVIFVAAAGHGPAPPAADLWAPVLGSENGERVKCNNNVDMQYVADQATCQALAVANGHPFYSFRHNGENRGHKCMSSAHCDDHLTDRTNEWHIYSMQVECPAGWQQVGEPGADIGGCGLQTCGERYEEETNTPAKCAEACAARSDCRGFNFAPKYGDRNHESETICTMYNSDTPTGTWYGSAGYVQIFCKPEQEWTVVQGGATSSHAGVNVGADAFNTMFASCPVVRYTQPSMTGSPAVYKRHASAGAYPGDAHALFTYLWAKANNAFHTDFDIYPSLEDARAGTNPWQFCNFSDEPQPNHFTVGFPRDCGPAVYQPHIWFHATNSGGTQTQGFFEIYTGGNCPV